MNNLKPKTPMEYINIGELNHGQSSRIVRGLAERDGTALIQRNGKPVAVLISYERYTRMFERGIDITEQ